MKPDYDTTLARIAGNVASGMLGAVGPQPSGTVLARRAVDVAELIVDEVRAREGRKTQASAALVNADLPQSRQL